MQLLIHDLFNSRQHETQLFKISLGLWKIFRKKWMS